MPRLQGWAATIRKSRDVPQMWPQTLRALQEGQRHSNTARRPTSTGPLLSIGRTCPRPRCLANRPGPTHPPAVDEQALAVKPEALVPTRSPWPFARRLVALLGVPQHQQPCAHGRSLQLLQPCQVSILHARPYLMTVPDRVIHRTRLLVLKAFGPPVATDISPIISHSLLVCR